jgi:Fe-Mn family superoxide dismutase
MSTLIIPFLLALSCGSVTDESGGFKLIELPYATDALEPYISQETIELHHGKHLQTYVNNLNKVVAGTPKANLHLTQIVADSEGTLFNNAGQVLNHNLYFLQFSPKGGGRPKGELARAIQKQWGSFETFQRAFESQGLALFGSGWVWLAVDEDGVLHIVQEPNGGNPVKQDMIPLLGFDVWEHAYYLDYANRRADYLTSLWNIVDWNVVEARYMMK